MINLNKPLELGFPIDDPIINMISYEWYNVVVEQEPYLDGKLFVCTDPYGKINKFICNTNGDVLIELMPDYINENLPQRITIRNKEVDIEKEVIVNGHKYILKED